VSTEAGPDRHALLELQALPTQIASLRGEGDAARFAADERYRWLLHRLWIAAGNEALAYTQATGQPVRAEDVAAAGQRLEAQAPGYRHLSGSAVHAALVLSALERAPERRNTDAGQTWRCSHDQTRQINRLGWEKATGARRRR
jgi:hypothetical protein